MKPILPFALVMALPFGAGAQSASSTVVPRSSSPPVPGSVDRVTPPPAGTPVEMTRLPDGFAKIGGVVYIVDHGVVTRVDQELSMKVAADGTVTNFDGRAWMIPSEQLITRDGRNLPISPAMRDSRAAESAQRLSNENGNNYSGLSPTPPGSSSTAGASGTGGSSSEGSASSAPFTGGPRTTNPNAYPASQSPTPNRNNGSGGQVFIDPATVPFGIYNPGLPDPNTPAPIAPDQRPVNTRPNTDTGTGTTNPNARSTGNGNGNATGTQGTGSGTSTGGNTNTGARPSTGTTGGSGGTSTGGGGASGGSASGGGVNGGGGR